MTLNATTLRNLEILNNQVKACLTCLLTATDCQNKEARPVRLISEGHHYWPKGDTLHVYGCRVSPNQLQILVICALLLTDRWRSEGQSAVGSGPHPHSFWEENVEEVGEPAPHRHRVSPQLNSR